MADQPPFRGTDDTTGMERDRESTIGTPRWVKLFGIIFIVLILLFAILHLTGRGLGGHTPSGSRENGNTLPSSVTAHGAHEP